MNFVTGADIEVEIEGRTIRGRLELASANGRSLAVSFDEGVPAPFFFMPDTGRQYLLLARGDDGTWTEVGAGRPVTVTT